MTERGAVARDISAADLQQLKVTCPYRAQIRRLKRTIGKRPQAQVFHSSPSLLGEMAARSADGGEMAQAQRYRLSTAFGGPPPQASLGRISGDPLPTATAILAADLARSKADRRV